MVGIDHVYLVDEDRHVWIYSNEERCEMFGDEWMMSSTGNDTDIIPQDVFIDGIIFDAAPDDIIANEYWQVYKDCWWRYVKNDCLNFSDNNYFVDYQLLPNRLKSQITSWEAAWHIMSGEKVETDGWTVEAASENPDYSYQAAQIAEFIQDLNEHIFSLEQDVLDTQRFYIMFGDNRQRLRLEVENNADNYSVIDEALRKIFNQC